MKKAYLCNICMTHFSIITKGKDYLCKWGLLARDVKTYHRWQTFSGKTICDIQARKQWGWNPGLVFCSVLISVEHDPCILVWWQKIIPAKARGHSRRNRNSRWISVHTTEGQTPDVSTHLIPSTLYRTLMYFLNKLQTWDQNIRTMMAAILFIKNICQHLNIFFVPHVFSLHSIISFIIYIIYEICIFCLIREFTSSIFMYHILIK